MHYLTFLKSKIIPREKLKNRLNYWRFKGQKIVFTNGCFDILHRGHVEYLAQAAELGDCLIVGLNSDNSVKKLKGTNRPLNNQGDRAFLLAEIIQIKIII